MEDVAKNGVGTFKDKFGAVFKDGWTDEQVFDQIFDLRVNKGVTTCPENLLPQKYLDQTYIAETFQYFEKNGYACFVRDEMVDRFGAIGRSDES
jgi:hypothetical protein